MRGLCTLLLVVLQTANADFTNPGKGIALDVPSKNAHTREQPNNDPTKSNKQSQIQVFVTVVDSCEKESKEPEDSTIDRAKKDLIAQQEMAVASKEMSNYTLLGMFLSFLALAISAVIGALSFRFSRQSLEQSEALQKQTLARMDAAEANSKRFHAESIVQSRVIHDQTIKEMAESEARARITSENDLRAYLLPEITVHAFHELNNILNGHNTPNPPNQAIYQLHIKNVGKTPAKKVYPIWEIKVGDWPNPEDGLFEDLNKMTLPDKIAATVFPGVTRSNPINIPNKFTSVDIDKIKNKKYAIFIYGRIVYEDIFGHTRKSDFRFCHFVKTVGGSFDNYMEACYQGNDAT